jgi:hypothetical protein
MIKPVKDRESWLFDQIWNIRNTSSTLPIQDKKRNTSSMNKLGDISSGWREGIKLLRNFHLTKVKQNFSYFYGRRLLKRINLIKYYTYQ